MEISLVNLLLVATGCALISAIVVSVCTMCCCWVRGRLRRNCKATKKCGERLLYDIECPKMIPMERCQPKATIASFESENGSNSCTAKETKKGCNMSDGNSHYIFDERTVAEKASSEDCGLLWTSNGQVLQSMPGGKHVVEQFTTTNKYPEQITELYMKESPCYTCSSKLIKHFAQCHKKPAVFLGRIRHLNNVSDREGLRELIQEGFNVNTWTHLCKVMYNDDTSSTDKYIKELKNETTMYCYFGIYN